MLRFWLARMRAYVCLCVCVAPVRARCAWQDSVLRVHALGCGIDTVHMCVCVCVAPVCARRAWQDSVLRVHALGCGIDTRVHFSSSGPSLALEVLAEVYTLAVPCHFTLPIHERPGCAS